MNYPRYSRRDFVRASLLGASAILLKPSGWAAVAAPTRTTKLTMLNSMAGSDFETAARRHAELGVQWLDLKESFWGENINNLSVENARRAAAIARAHGLKVFCFSTAICDSDLGAGESEYRSRHQATLDHVLKIADILEPRYIRLISAKLNPFPSPGTAMAVVEQKYSWVFAVYRDLADQIVASGRQALIENETPNSILERPEGILRFFERLERSGKYHYTWDVQNLWQMGVFPTLDVYHQLKPIIGCIHLKGGRTEGASPALVHASALEEASWPVVDIVRAAVADGVAPFLCLNPSHGLKPPGFDVWAIAQRDVNFIRQHVSASL